MRRLAILFTGIFLAQVATAQSHKAKDLNLNLGVGIGGGWYGGTYTNRYPAGIFSAEYGVLDELSIGGILAFSGTYYESVNPAISYNYRSTFLVVGPRASFHFSELLDLNTDALDLYAGAQAGIVRRSRRAVQVNRGTVNLDASVGTRSFFALHIGARYFFKPNFGIYTELAFGMPTLSLGFVYRRR